MIYSVSILVSWHHIIRLIPNRIMIWSVSLVHLCMLQRLVIKGMEFIDEKADRGRADAPVHPYSPDSWSRNPGRHRYNKSGVTREACFVVLEVEAAESVAFAEKPMLMKWDLRLSSMIHNLSPRICASIHSSQIKAATANIIHHQLT